MSITVDARDIAGVIMKLDREMRARLKRGMKKGAHRGRGILVRKTPTDTGQARAGWRVVESPGSNPYIPSDVVSRIVNDAPHIGIIEAGARPHAVSDAGILAIEAWVRRKGLADDAVSAARERNVGLRALGGAGVKVPSYDAAVHAIAMGIVWKLRHFGQEPTYFVRDALPSLRRAMAREVMAEIKALFRDPPRKP
jgi:hypothetical protein